MSFYCETSECSTAPPTHSGDGDVCGLAGRAVAEADDGAVVGGRGRQTRNGHQVRSDGLRLPRLKTQIHLTHFLLKLVTCSEADL